MSARSTVLARRGLALALAAVLGAMTWLRTPPLPPNHDLTLRIEPLELAGEPRLGPFRLTGAWVLTSPNSQFGGYSALVQPEAGRLLALSDRGQYLDFAVPGARAGPVGIGPVLSDPALLKRNRDVEAASWDSRGGHLWLALEGRDAVIRQGLDMKPEALRTIPEWRDWGANTGPEAMVRLHDGRFVVLCECNMRWLDGVNHPGFLYAGDPAQGVAGQAFTFAGADGYRPTDLAELPDGRVLVLMRRLLWPAPARFAARIMLADPDAIVPGQTWRSVQLADLSAPLPVDNMEALTVQSLPGGRLIAWIMSDNNEAVSQRTVLWRLEFSLSGLPAKQKAPG